MLRDNKREMAQRVERIEQQIPVEWKAFSGNPMQMAYYTTNVNTFRKNADLLHPSNSFTTWAAQELRRGLANEGRHLNDADLKSIIYQEWRTDLTRNLLEIRLNRHGSKDGPVVRRSPSGALNVAPQPALSAHSCSSTTDPHITKFVLDAIATPDPYKKK